MIGSEVNAETIKKAASLSGVWWALRDFTYNFKEAEFEIRGYSLNHTGGSLFSRLPL